MTPNGYFGGPFFGAYNPGGAPLPTPVAPENPDAELTDGRVLKWAASQLRGSGKFADVGVGWTAQPAAGDSYPAAWIYPIGFNEADTADPILLTRTFRLAIQLTIQVTGLDEGQELDQLDGLVNLIADLIGDGPPNCIAGLTRISDGRYHATQTGTGKMLSNAYVKAGVTVNCEVAYLIEGRAGRIIDDE